MRRLPACLALAVLVATAPGCMPSGDSPADDDQAADADAGTGPGSDPDPSQPDAGDEDPPPVPDSAVAVLEIYEMDIWAQFLPAGTRLAVTSNGQRIDAGGFPIAQVPLTDASDLHISLTAPDHETLDLDVGFDGSATLDGLHVTSDLKGTGNGLSATHEMRVLEEGRPAIPVHTLYLGLRHSWFSSDARPARRGNDIELMMDGEEAWRTVYEQLTTASTSILLATWWFESDFELLRDDPHADEATRSGNTIMAILEASPAYKRVLVGQFWGQDGLLDWVTADETVRDHGDQTGDDFEFMGQANETEGVFWFAVPGFDFGDRVRAEQTETTHRTFDREAPIESTVPAHEVDLTEWPIDVEVEHASWHQKFMVVDDVAFVGGMNVKGNDWDTSQHYVFDSRRMAFDASAGDRTDVDDGASLPDNPPRKDYMVRIDGPAVQDVADAFHRRWDLAMDEGVDYSWNASTFDVHRDLEPIPGGSQIQITTTMPDPLWEHGIVETWLNAVSHAEDYIYIEDQYFRSPILTDAILERMAEVPDLKLIVITKPINEWTDPGCAWTYITDDELKTALGDRYLLLQLRSFDWVVTWGFDESESRFADMDTHSKMLIVDDMFMSVGSANKNNRGLIYEGEMNVAILDPVWVADARRRIMENILPAGTPATDDIGELWSQLVSAADWNSYVYGNWDAEGGDISLDGAPLPEEYTPQGFVYHMDFPGVDECLLESVGPDMT